MTATKHPSELLKMDDLRAGLAATDDPVQVEDIRDKATWARAWVKRQAKKLAKADTPEAQALREAAAAQERQFAELTIRAESRLGELAGAPASAQEAGAKGGRGKLSEAPDSFDADRRRVAEWRKVHAAATYLEPYLAHADEKGDDVSRDGLLAYARAAQKAAEVDEAARDQREGGAPEPTSLGEKPAATVDPAEMDAAERAAKELLQVAAKLAKDPLKGWAGIYLSGRDEAVLKIKGLAGWLANLSREARDVDGAA